MEINDNDVQQMVDETRKLIDFALQGQHFKETIRHFSQLRSARAVAKSNKNLAKGFKLVRDEFYSQYLKASQLQRANSELICSIMELDTCVQFYSQEYRLIKKAIRDYWHWFFSADILEVFGGRE